MSDLMETAQQLGCSPAFVEFDRLPLTFSQIALVAGMTITNPQRQTGPNYEVRDRNQFDFTTETGPDGTAIIFNNLEGGTTGEVVFDAPKYRSQSRHVIHAHLSAFSPGDYRPPARNRHATLYIGDMGMVLSSTDEREMLEKYGTMVMRSRRWSYNNRGGLHTFGFNVMTDGGISLRYAWNKDEHVYGWSENHNSTSVVPFFGIENPTRIRPVFEAKFTWDVFKTMLNRAGRAKDRGGALYWSYSPKTKQFYSIGAYADGTISKEGQNSQIPVWIDNSVQGLVSGTIPYRPFGEAVVNRYKTATHVAVGLDDLGRQYIAVYYDWGYVRYNHITFQHGVITESDIENQTGGPLKVTEGEKPAFFNNFDLTFEYSPYTAYEEKFLNKWYAEFNQHQERQVSRPILPKKGEILQWYITYCQFGSEVTDEDEMLARKILS